MFSEHGVVSVGDLLESLGLKEKSTDAGRRGSDGAKMDAQIHRLPPYFFLPRSSSTQSMDGECDEPRALDLTAATVSIEEKLVEKVGVGFTHAKEIAEEVLAAVGRALSENARVRRVGSDQLFHFDTLDGMADFANDFVPEDDKATAKPASPSNGAAPELPKRDPAAAAATAAAIRANVEANAGGVKPASDAAKAAARANDTKIAQEVVRSKSGGGFYSPAFLRAVAPLYDLHMGAENLGPLLYAYVRFTKPARVLEVGAGYTSMFILQALRDNAAELDAYRELRGAGICKCGDVPWSVDDFFVGGKLEGRYRGDPLPEKTSPGGSRRQSRVSRQSGIDGGSIDDEGLGLFSGSEGSGPSFSGWTAGRVGAAAPGSEDARVNEGVLHCIDNMAHEHTTAHVVTRSAAELGMSDRLQLHEADAYDGDLPSVLAPGVEFDFMFIDLGAANRVEGFMEAWWPRVRPEGGMVMVHSTLTNALSRGWLEKMRQRSRSEPAPPYGSFETMSLLEPHKMFQNSVTLFQKRGGPFGTYDEPVHTKFP